MDKQDDVKPGKPVSIHGQKDDSREDIYKDLKVRIFDKVVEEVTISQENEDNMQIIEDEIRKIANEVIETEAKYLTRNERNIITRDIINETIGFGPITPLLSDPDINEVMVNGPNQVYVERQGRLELSDTTFKDNNHIFHIIERIVAPLGRRIDESSPMVDARLPNGSRVNIIIPPLALNGPTITIRKFSDNPYTVNDLIRFGTLTAEVAQFLKACVEARLNIIVSGGTGSGKTTTLNVISSFIPSDERIVTIEDAAELQLKQDHVVRLETRPPNVEGKGAVSIRDLVRNSLRMRPDRIVVGEVRSGEALDMLQAMNTGHDGSLTTAHANSPRDILSRLETMVLMSGMELPVRAIREQISSAIDLIVQQTRLKDGTRRITYITEVSGMEGEVITLQDIFVYKEEGLDNTGGIKGRLVPTGLKPGFMDKLAKTGVVLPTDLFTV
ncbi:MAG TPA: Flp pilus assembly complex ATPase component TadA [Clostridiaceae bacterium]|nr:Flp pilus assembly complex ATPase component TadA [Clostridiaceae bacterium]